jgi:hypothetical protein
LQSVKRFLVLGVSDVRLGKQIIDVATVVSGPLEFHQNWDRLARLLDCDVANGEVESSSVLVFHSTACREQVRDGLGELPTTG